jgi:hypothetical protein
MAPLLRRYLSSLFALAIAFSGAARLCGQDASPEKIFAAVPFDLWVKQGPAMAIPWKVRIQPFGLSLHQRMRAHIDVQVARRELKNRPPDDRMVVLIQVTDAAGEQFRDYTLFRMKDVGAEIKKGEVDVYWNMYLLPGEYRVTVVLVDAAQGQHNLMQSQMHIERPRNDPLPGIWLGLPAVEFLSPRLEGPDFIFRPDVTSRLHLPLATRHPVELEVLADVTASDLFRGSTVFYNRYLSVALPLLKALSQVSLEQGSLNVAMLDLRQRRVTFEQNNVKILDWPRARSVLAPENGPGMIDIKVLEQRRESPAFLQDELLRRLNAAPVNPQASGETQTSAEQQTSAEPQTSAGSLKSADTRASAEPRTSAEPLHVFVIIGSPMDFYSFRDLPHLPPGSEEKCVVYYLQFELLNTNYADGAIGNVRKMLKPLTVHVFKVRSAESVRHALAKILEEVAAM